MKANKLAARRMDIEKAAYEILAERGYAATSMLTIAKRAGASNQTLYKWYGNKQNLFAALVRENARDLVALLTTSLDQAADPLHTLREAGSILLRVLSGERAVALQRAAVIDAAESGVLGHTLAEMGRDTVMPLFIRVFARMKHPQIGEDPREAAEIYLGVLVGDLQIRRASGVLADVDDNEIKRRVDRAIRVISAVSIGSE